jgi:WD40 repeat protein
VNKASQIKLEPDGRSFFVPPNYSPIRTARLRFHPSGDRLIAQVSDRRLAAWDLKGKAERVKGARDPVVLPVACCEQAEGWVGGFDFHPDGKCLVTGGTDRKLRRWTWQDGKPSATADAEAGGHGGWIEAVAYSPDGKALATGCGDGRVRLVDPASLKVTVEMAGHKAPVRDVAWTADGKWLVSGGEDGLCLVFDAAGKLARTIEFGNVNQHQGQDPGHSGVFRLALSRDGLWLAVAGHRKSSLFELASGKLVGTDAGGFDAAFHPGGPFLITGFDATKVFRLGAEKLARTPEPSKKSPQVPAPGDTIATLKRNNGYGLAVSRDGKLVAAATGESTVGLWNVTGL